MIEFDHASAALNAENSEFRWDWKTRKLYRIADRALYDRRLAAFKASCDDGDLLARVRAERADDPSDTGVG